eukprot:g3924.t1
METQAVVTAKYTFGANDAAGELDEAGLQILRGEQSRGKSLYVYDDIREATADRGGSFSLGLSKSELKAELRRLADYAKRTEMNKNYGEISLDYRKHCKYLFGRNVQGVPVVSVKRRPPCSMCKDNKVSVVFFPCRHACICDTCRKLHNIGTEDRKDMTAWRACPICMEEIKRVYPIRSNAEEMYWDWVYEVKPPIPWIDREKFSQAARSLQQGIIPKDGNMSSDTARSRLGVIDGRNTVRKKTGDDQVGAAARGGGCCLIS